MGELVNRDQAAALQDQVGKNDPLVVVDGRRIRESREGMKLSLRALEKRLRGAATYAFLSQLESGKVRRCRLSLLKRFAVVLQENPAWFRGQSEERSFWVPIPGGAKVRLMIHGPGASVRIPPEDRSSNEPLDAHFFAQAMIDLLAWRRLLVYGALPDPSPEDVEEFAEHMARAVGVLCRVGTSLNTEGAERLRSLLQTLERAADRLGDLWSVSEDL